MILIQKGLWRGTWRGHRGGLGHKDNEQHGGQHGGGHEGSTMYSQAVTHPSTNIDQDSLTLVIGLVFST